MLSGVYPLSKMVSRDCCFVYDFFYLLYDIIVSGAQVWSLMVKPYKFIGYNYKQHHILLHEYTGMHHAGQF